MGDGWGAYLLFAAALMLLFTGRVPGDFFPKSDRNQFVCDLFLPAGTPIKKTDEYQAHLERLIRALGAKSYVSNVLGERALRFDRPENKDLTGHRPSRTRQRLADRNLQPPNRLAGLREGLRL